MKVYLAGLQGRRWIIPTTRGGYEVEREHNKSNMMIYLAALMGVPKDLYEACDIDGANFWQKHLTVTVPHIMPAIALVTTISSISAMKIFAEIYVMTKGGPLNSTKTIVYYIYEKAFENLDLGVASAMAVILLVIVMIFSLINIFCFERKKYDL
jgi:putative chitobiose transport system permease protein